MKLLIVCAILLSVAVSINAQRKVVCYWGTWAAYRPGDGQFDTRHMDPTICTHMIYSFFGVTTTGSVTYLDSWLDLDKDGGFIKNFIALKAKNPNVRMLAAAGGWTFGSRIFSELAANSNSRQNLANNVVAFCRLHGFDGFDLDWEYPAQRDGNPAIDKHNFSLLLIELKRALGAAGLLLSIAVASAEFSAAISYDIPVVSANVDFINVMTYDLQGPWDGYTGIHGAFFPGPGTNPQLNVDAAINYWLSQGAAREKLIVGIGTYGKSFTLANPANNGVGAAITGPGAAGPYTREAGTLGYSEICVNNWPRQWEKDQKVPYAFNGNQWVGYDDLESVILKSNYVVDNNLGGTMFWSVETDDFRGACGQGKNPLISTSYGIVMNGQQPPIPTQPTQPPPTQPTQPTPPQTIPPGGSFVCPSDGYFRDPNDCQSYYVCSHGNASRNTCPAGTLFDDVAKICNWAEAVTC